MGILFLPLVVLPLLVSCAERAEQNDGCKRPTSCPDKRPVPILY